MHTDATVAPRRRPLLKRLFVFAGFGIASLTVLVTIAWIVENIRGKAAWRRFQAEWTAKGEKFGLAAYVPARVPDEENFARTPLLAPLLEYDRRPNVKWRDPAGQQQAMTLANPFRNKGKATAPPLGDWTTAQVVDLEAWRKYLDEHPEFGGGAQASNAAAAVLTALEHFEPALTELNKAAQRPSAVFPVHYDENFHALLPHLSVLKGITSILVLRAVANLAAGNSDRALADIRLGIRMSDALKPEPFIISQLVRAGMIQQLMQPVWEGMAERRWNDSQLSDLQILVRGIPMLEVYGQCTRGERALGNEMFERVRSGRVSTRELANATSPGLPPTGFVPVGWIYQNQTTLNRVYQEHVLPIIDLEKRRAFPSRAWTAENLPVLKSRGPYNIMAALLVPAVVKTASTFARQQAHLDLAAVAAALERYRNSHEQYPEHLAELAPGFIATVPDDVTSGEPLKYERTADGRYVLYSIGWNEKDDQGTSPGHHKQTEASGDWVWAY